MFRPVLKITLVHIMTRPIIQGPAFRSK